MARPSPRFAWTMSARISILTLLSSSLRKQGHSGERRNVGPGPLLSQGRRFRRIQRRSGRTAALPRLHHVAQHVLQDAAVAEVFDLVERVDAAQQLDGFLAAIGAVDAAAKLHARLSCGS